MRASIDRNAARGSVERPSKATALRRCRMMARARTPASCVTTPPLCGAGSTPRTRAAAATRRLGTASGRQRDLVDDRPVDARGTQRVCPSCPDRATSGLDERFGIGVQPRLYITGGDCHDAFRLFPLGAGEVRIPIDASHGRDVRIRPAREQHQAPAKERGGKTQCRNRMAGVMLAIAERPLSVFPGFAPVNRRQRDQKSWIRAGQSPPRRRTHRGPLFERMLPRRIVVHAAVADQVRLGRVEIAARGIDPERPAGAANLLPRRQPQGTAEQGRDACVGDGGNRRGRVEQGVIGNIGGEDVPRKGNEGRAGVAAERIGLCRPVEMTSRPGEAVEMVLRGLVIREGRVVGTPEGAPYFDSSLIRRSSSAIA